MTRGVVYIAFGPTYVEKTKQSARSLSEHNPSLDITLFTDETVDSPVFDTVKRQDGFLAEKGDSILTEDHMVYDENLYLDADTYVCGSITELFDILERDDIAAAHNEARSWHHQDVYDTLDREMPTSFTEYNSGVISYSDDRAVVDLFERWNDLYDQIGHERNQPSFRLALYESGIDLATIPPEYNFMTHTVGFASGEVKILHQGPSDQNLSVWAERLNSVPGKKVTSWERVPCRVIPDSYSSIRYKLQTGTREDLRDALRRARRKWRRDGFVSMARSVRRELFG